MVSGGLFSRRTALRHAGTRHSSLQNRCPLVHVQRSMCRPVTRRRQFSSHQQMYLIAPSVCAAVPESRQEEEAFLPEELTLEDVQRATSGKVDTDVWAHKPAWCQPWSILATGAGFVGIVNTISGRSPVWTGLSAVPILVWWYVFLVAYPAEFKAYILSRREGRM